MYTERTGLVVDGSDGSDGAQPAATLLAVVAPPGVTILGKRFSTPVVAAASVLAMIAVGFALGFALPPPSQDAPPWDRVSAVIGWLYFNAWAVSFLPQLYLNYVRRCVIGQSFDYVFMNVLGFFSYSVYNIAFYSVTSVQQEYHERYHDDNNVQANDVGFAVYALLCCVLNSYQIYRYDRGNQRATRAVLAGIALTVVVFLVWMVILLCGLRAERVFNTLDFLYGLSMVKLGVSLIKYIPQVYLNFTRKCTVGWNIWNVLLDFTGGSLSVAQELIDCASSGSWNGIAGNPAKFALGSMSMVYDVIFMVQHFCLYRENNKKLHQGLDDGQRSTNHHLYRSMPSVVNDDSTDATPEDARQVIIKSPPMGMPPLSPKISTVA